MIEVENIVRVLPEKGCNGERRFFFKMPEKFKHERDKNQ